jgi:hypothetical protein
MKDSGATNGSRVKLFHWGGNTSSDITIYRDDGSTVLCHLPCNPTFGYGYCEVQFLDTAVTTVDTLGTGWRLVNPGNCTT